MDSVERPLRPLFEQRATIVEAIERCSAVPSGRELRLQCEDQVTYLDVGFATFVKFVPDLVSGCLAHFGVLSADAVSHVCALPRLQRIIDETHPAEALSQQPGLGKGKRKTPKG
uniref:Uncharacterized protein n=1 Tax=Alexandrium monilatum TaxID=311494 RepID=A0A7S4UVU7_9DINO|mmetsp:Transcript_82766/g.246942  ORF Transcript_82766/g.246942 Transcript_82766/m.246942 type:complete len:114 (-) Transcript_82766:74-415(-)